MENSKKIKPWVDPSLHGTKAKESTEPLFSIFASGKLPEQEHLLPGGIELDNDEIDPLEREFADDHEGNVLIPQDIGLIIAEENRKKQNPAEKIQKKPATDCPAGGALYPCGVEVKED